MLDVMETYIQRQEYTYMRMDGGTTISARQPLITQFNAVCWIQITYDDFVICWGFCNSLGFFFSRVIFNIYLQFDENACFISQQAQLADNALVRKINHSFS